MLTYFRHKRSASSKASQVQGGNHNGATNQANNSREISTEPERKQSQSHKKKSDWKAIWGKTSKKFTNTKRDEPLNGD